MSLSGLNQQYIPNTLDGLNVIEADQIYIDGQLVDLTDYVPYQGASRTIDAGSQTIKTTHTATAANDVVNKGLLDTTISNLTISIAGSFLDKVTTTPQTVIGNTTFTAQLTSDNLVVPATKVANLGTVVEVGPNYKQAVTDANVTVGQYFGTITSSLGVYQSTSSQDMGTVILGSALTVGQRYRVYINVLGSDTSDTNVVMYQSSNGTTFNASIVSEYFNANSTIFRVMNQTFTASYPYVILALFTAGGGATLKWFGLERYEVGVELEKVTLPLLTASKVPILNDKKQLVASGTDASKLDYLDNVGSDIQTQLNSKLNLSGSNANQNIIIGAYKVQSSATPSVGDDYTNKTYVDGAITTAGALYVKKAGDTMTGDLSMGVNKVKCTAPPLVDDDLTRKGYVDSGLALKATLAANQTFIGTNTFSSSLPIVLSGLTPSRVLQLSGTAVVQASTVTNTELGYVSGVTSAIQTQLNTLSGTFANYLPLTGGTLSGNLTVGGASGVSLTNVATTNGFLSTRFYIGARGDNQDDVGSDNKWGPWYGLGESGIAGFTGIPCLAGFAGVALRTSSGTFIMKEDGTVGIGTTNVLGLFNISYDGGQDFLTLQNTKYGASDHYINLRFMFGKDNTTQASAYIQAYLNSSLETALRFFTDDGSGSGVAERMRIIGDGRVGIGTTDPDTELYVVGKGKFHNGTVGIPANATNGGDGTRLVLWPGNAGACPYALGIDGGTLWYGTPSLATHKWYNGTTNVMGLDGNGNLYRSNYVPYLFTNMFVSTSGSNGSLAVCAGNENDNAILYLGTPFSPTVSSGSAYKVAIIADGNGSGTGWSTADLHFCLNGTTGSNDWTQSASLSHSRMVIKSSSGRVGIGTISPVGQLDIYNTGADYTNSLVVRTPWAGIAMDNTQVGGGRKWNVFSGGPGAGIGVGNFGIFDETASAYRFSINTNGSVWVHRRLIIGGSLAGADGSLSIRNTGGNYSHFGYDDGLNYIRGNTMFDTNYVTIGANYSHPYPLWVATSQNTFWYLAWYYSSSGGFAHNNNGTWPVSIWATGAIVTEYWFGTVSDRRIKTNIKPVGDMLDIINKIEVVSFDFIDPITHKRDECGVIAQQVEEVFPNLVDKSIGVVPNIMKCVSAFEKIGETLKLYYKREDSDELIPTSKVKLILGVLGQTIEESSTKGEYLVQVIDVDPDFIVVEWKHNVDLDGLGVFVYGKEVDDFRNVDKEQLGVMAIKGIQELYAKQDEQQHSRLAEEASLRKQIDVLVERNKVLEAWARDSEAKTRKMEERMEKMASLLAQLISKQ